MSARFQISSKGFQSPIFDKIASKIANFSSKSQFFRFFAPFGRKKSKTFASKVRNVFADYSDILHVIFETYSALDLSSSDALKNMSTMNISEFLMLLRHCELFDDVLTEDESRKIFADIQQSSIDVKEETEAGVDDDDELSYGEFLDGIVAVVMYKDPNPFVDFAERVEGFLIHLFGRLRSFWSRSAGETTAQAHQVKRLLHELQKKLGVTD